jgi:hypothetical protein
MASRTIRGGGTIWGNGWTISLSALLVKLTFNEQTITINFPERGIWLKMLEVQSRTFSHRLDPAHDLRWTCQWNDLSCALVARRSLILIRADGVRCRFKSVHRQRMSELRAALAMHEIDMRPVRTTLGHHLRD